jgi:hypothetical protein
METIKSMAPTTPPLETCPLLDQLIEQGADPELVNQIRHANARLRNLSYYWHLTAKRLHKEGNAK